MSSRREFWVPPWSSCSVLDHRSLPPMFESLCGHIWRLFYLWLCFITFGVHSAHLAYLVHKSGCKTSIILPCVTILWLEKKPLTWSFNFYVHIFLWYSLVPVCSGWWKRLGSILSLPLTILNTRIISPHHLLCKSGGNLRLLICSPNGRDQRLATNFIGFFTICEIKYTKNMVT